MIRRAFTMRLKPGKLAEYKRFHDNVWPELVAEIEKSGIASMTIFENDPVLFLYSEIADEGAWDRLWRTKIHDRWSEAMNPLMVFRDDEIVDSSTLREVFHLTWLSQTGATNRLDRWNHGERDAHKNTDRHPRPSVLRDHLHVF